MQQQTAGWHQSTVGNPSPAGITAPAYAWHRSPLVTAAYSGTGETIDLLRVLYCTCTTKHAAPPPPPVTPCTAQQHLGCGRSQQAHRPSAHSCAGAVMDYYHSPCSCALRALHSTGHSRIQYRTAAPAVGPKRARDEPAAPSKPQHVSRRPFPRYASFTHASWLSLGFPSEIIPSPCPARIHPGHTLVQSHHAQNCRC